MCSVRFQFIHVPKTLCWTVPPSDAELYATFTLSACRLLIFWTTFSTALYVHQLFMRFLSSIVGWLTNVDMKIWLLSAILLSELLFYVASVPIHFGHLHHVDDHHLFTHHGQWWRQPLMKIQQVTRLLPKFFLLADSWSSTPRGERRMRDTNKISIVLFFKSNMHMHDAVKTYRNKKEARFAV